MSDMRKLLESMTKFAGEPAQRPGDQVRGTERAKKKKSGQHPFQGRLVGEDNIFKELEKQLVEGDVERRLREEFEQFNEFAPDDGDSGGEDDALRNYAKMWWAGDEATQMQIEKVLARMGWEIGEDEGGYDNGGVFVVRAGDENGNSYQSWAAEDLTEGLTEVDRRGFLRGLGAAAVAGTAGGANAFDFGKKNNEKKFEDFITEPADKEKYLGLHKKAKQLYTAMAINPSLRAAAYVEIAAFKTFKKQMAEKYKISDNLDEQGVAEGIFGFGTKVPTKDKVEPADDFSAKLLDRRQKQQTQAPKEKVYRGPEEYRQEKEKDVEEGIFGFMSKPEPTKKKEPPDAFADKLDAQRIKNLTQHKPTLADKKKPNVRVITKYTEQQVNELGANNPPQPTAPVAGNPAQTAPAQPVDPKAAAALKQNLMKLKTSVPGLDITKATTAMTKADTGVPLTPGDKNITSVIAPQLANVMKNPQMASSLKMMIDKANQQEKAAAAKPPGTV